MHRVLRCALWLFKFIRLRARGVKGTPCLQNLLRTRCVILRFRIVDFSSDLVG